MVLASFLAMKHHKTNTVLLAERPPQQVLLKCSLLALLLLILPACSVITETECRFADFTELGYADASKGKLREHFNKYQEKCLTYNIDLSEEIVMYDLGRERGLHNYCNSVKFSSQCDRGSGGSQVKSYLHINAEMLRLRSGLPNIGSSLNQQ